MYDICTGTTIPMLCNMGNKEIKVLARIRQHTMNWGEHPSLMQVQTIDQTED